MFQFVMDNVDDDRVIETDLVSFWVWDCMDLKARKIIGLIETLYEHNLVHDSICGTLEEVRNNIFEPIPKAMPEADPEIFSFYKSLHRLVHPEASHEITEPENKEQRESPVGPEDDHYKDVGRNDPCPCGSGKKFKKCCLE